MGAVLSSRNRALLRILLLDESQGAQARLTLLRESGHPITLARSLPEATKALRAGEFDVVVADHPSANVDAQLTIRQLHDLRANVAVILISAFADSLGLNEANTGADIVIQKSAHEVAHLIRSVARLQRRKPKRKPVRSVTLPSAARVQTV